MPQRKNPDTSIAAFHSLNQAAVLATKSKIIECLKVIGSGTSEEIADYLGSDYDVIWKRCSDLKNIDKKLCWTGEKRITRRCRMANVFCLTVTSQPKTDKSEKLMKGKSISEITKEIKQTIDRPLNQISMF